MPRIIVFDTILNTINYCEITDDTNMQYIIRSPHIGYYTIHFDYKPYYYIIWCDTRFNNYKISPMIKYYFSVLNAKYSTDSGIYIVSKYDKITHSLLDINNTLDDIRIEII
jgi:hypothetical protein